MTRDFDNVLLSLNYVRYFKEKKKSWKQFFSNNIDYL